jgi:hypothetical protein
MVNSGETKKALKIISYLPDDICALLGYNAASSSN